MPLNNLSTGGRTFYSVSMGKTRNSPGSMNRILSHCTSTSPDLNVAFNCAFKTQYFNKSNLSNIFNTTTARETVISNNSNNNNGIVNVMGLPPDAYKPR